MAMGEGGGAHFANSGGYGGNFNSGGGNLTNRDDSGVNYSGGVSDYGAKAAAASRVGQPASSMNPAANAAMQQYGYVNIGGIWRDPATLNQNNNGSAAPQGVVQSGIAQAIKQMLSQITMPPTAVPIPQPKPPQMSGYYPGPGIDINYGRNLYSNHPYGGWTEAVDFGKDPSRVEPEGGYKDSGRLNPDSGQNTGPGGPFGGVDTPGGDVNRVSAMSMMAPVEQPLVNPGPIGPDGQPMGGGHIPGMSRPPMVPPHIPGRFQIGSPNLMLRHWQNQPMGQRRMEPRVNPRLAESRNIGGEGERRGGRQGEAMQIRRALRQERRRAHG